MGVAGQIVETVFTPDVVKQNTSLKDLSDDQVNAVVTLGNNLTQQRIGEKTKEYYDRLDVDIEEATGLKKEPSEKTFEFMKRAIKTGSKELSGQLATLKSEKDALEAQVKSGNVTDAVKKQITDLEGKIKDKESEVTQWKDKYTNDFGTKEKELNDALAKNMTIRVDHQFAEALTGIKFIEEAKLPKVARDATVSAAKIQVLNEFKPEYIDDGKGGEKLVWKNAQGEIARNPENKLEPFTTAELITKHLNPIIDHGRQQQGSGSTAPAGAASGKGQFFLNGAKTQVEADEMIVQHLIAEGVPKNTKEFDTKLKEIRTENKIPELPIR